MSEKLDSFRSEIYEHMLRTRGPKYKWFLRALRIFKYASMSPTRGAFLENYYALMRHVDDVVDGDAPLPEGYTSTEEYVSKRMYFARNPINPQEPIDHLIHHCIKLGKN